MIKKYEDFINESHSKTIKLTPEEVSLFTSEPLLQKLIVDKKVSLFDNEVKYDESDIQTKEVLDQYLEIAGKVEESWNVYDKNHPNEKCRDLFGEFERAKYKYSDEIKNIINKVASLEKTAEVERYLTELHKYYETLHYVPANLMKNIELKSSLK